MARKLESVEDIQNLFSDRLKEYAFTNGCKVSEIKILICFNPQTKEIECQQYVNAQFIKRLTLKEDILGIERFDFLLKEQRLKVALGYIHGSFKEGFINKYGSCKSEEVMVFLYTKQDEPIVPVIEKYKQGHRAERTFVTWQELEELF